MKLFLFGSRMHFGRCCAYTSSAIGYAVRRGEYGYSRRTQQGSVYPSNPHHASVELQRDNKRTVDTLFIRPYNYKCYS